MKVILNAYDFFMSRIYNQVILEGISAGWITSTSAMMTRYDDSQTKDLELLKNTNVSICLHIEFEDDRYQDQLVQQLDAFKKVFQQDPSHIDIHKGSQYPESHNLFDQFATENNIPMAMRHTGTNTKTATTVASISAIDNSADKLVAWAQAFNSDDIGEVILHPGSYDPDSASSLNYDRAVDVTKARILKEYFDANNISVVPFSG